MLQLALLLVSVLIVPGIMAQVSGYLDYSGVGKKLEALAQQHPDSVKLDSIGVSAGGRKIYIVRLAGGQEAPDKRPAVFVGANIAGFHNAGTQAAIHLVEKLVARKDELAARTFYIAPCLNPDAHDGMFQTPRQRRPLNGQKSDKDRDGLEGEDGPSDLNNDGRITSMRIQDPAGDMLPDPADPRIMIKADPLKGQKGAYRVVTEGSDDDGDGQYNEDPPGGYRPDKNFAFGFAHGEPESGPWPSYVPETKAIMDFLLARRNIALAIVYGPANNLLELPRGAGGPPGDVGQMRVTIPRGFANMLGVEPGQQMTVDEAWELVKDQPFVQQGGLTKERLAQFLGGGPPAQPDAEDLKYFTRMSEDYKKVLEKAGLDTNRSAKQSQAGGLTNWLYYQYGVMVAELDVWGIPKRKAEAKGEGALTLDRLEKMAGEEFVALGEEKIAAFLKGINAPPTVRAASLIEGVKTGKTTPARVAGMVRQMGAGGQRPGFAAGSGDQTDLMAYIDKEAQGAYSAWAPVTLTDGTKAEAGGVDPFVEIAPPEKVLEAAVAAHSEYILGLAAKLARLEVVSADSQSLGRDVWRVQATAANSGFLPTTSKLGERTRNYLPVRLELSLPGSASLVSGIRWVASERLEGSTGTLKGEWLVRARKGTKLNVVVTSDNAGTGRKDITLGGER